MSKPQKVKLTFAVTLEQPKGMSLSDMRTLILDGIKAVYPRLAEDSEDLKIKCHLTNKEVTYG